MKHRTICYKGCPGERETHFTCVAYNDDGRLCRQPATVLDPQRGGFICERHSAALIADLKAESTKEQAA